MAIKYDGKDLVKRIINGREVEKVMYNGTQIRPSEVPPTQDYLYFTPADSNGCTIRLNTYIYTPDPQFQSFECSFDGTNRIDFHTRNPIALNYGERLYIRNKSTTPTTLSESTLIYQFDITGLTNAYGDINYLLCKNSTSNITGDYCFSNLFSQCDLVTSPSLPATTLTAGCYSDMFSDCAYLTTPPQLDATTLAEQCYASMFSNCVALTTLPQLPATTLEDECYLQMFHGCTNIKLSEQQVDDYQTPYTIPTNGGGTVGYDSLENMFNHTGGTFIGTPSINTTYYTSNTVI